MVPLIFGWIVFFLRDRIILVLVNRRNCRLVDFFIFVTILKMFGYCIHDTLIPFAFYQPHD